MIALIAEKPSVAKDIARIIGATGRNDGYLSGNGYMVTWAFGHLIQLAMPEAYGVANFRRESLPILPPDFQLIPRQVKAEKGYKADPGVLVGLNSLLEQEGSITLPTGEIIRRHPDAVVVVTTNVSYEGCRGMNQSIIDRMSLVRDIELPSLEIMVQRAMSVTGATDEYQVSKMVQVVSDMADYCRKNSITDGMVGMRSLLDWIVSSEITGDVYEAAQYTIISKATSVEEDREALNAAILEPIFAPSKRKKTT